MKFSALVLIALMASAWLPNAALAQISEDEEFSDRDIQDGKRTSREQCEATRDAVWVEHRESSECIRYYPSANVTGAKHAAFFFHGDRLDGRFVIGGGASVSRPSALRKESEGLARVNGVPYIFVGRPGVYGSSGRHTERRSPKEYLSLNAAVDAIKARYGLERVSLAGQSGGASSVGALLTLGRSDVACAVASSGGFDTLSRSADIAARTGAQFRGCDAHGLCGAYNVIDHVGGVAASEPRRIFIVGDPQDSNTVFKYQQAFADKLAAAGHAVTVVEAEGRGPARHGLAHMANRVLGWCNAGFDSERIKALARSNAPALHAPKPKPQTGASQPSAESEPQ